MDDTYFVNQKRSTRELLSQIFLTETMVEDAEPKAPAKDAKLPKPVERKDIEQRKAKLVAALKEIGIEKPDCRLDIEDGSYYLCGDHTEHKADVALLLDMSKITPLIDAGFVVVDAEQGVDDCFSVMIIAADAAESDFPGEGGVSELDGMTDDFTK